MHGKQHQVWQHKACAGWAAVLVRTCGCALVKLGFILLFGCDARIEARQVQADLRQGGVKFRKIPRKIPRWANASTTPTLVASASLIDETLYRSPGSGVFGFIVPFTLAFNWLFEGSQGGAACVRVGGGHSSQSPQSPSNRSQPKTKKTTSSRRPAQLQREDRAGKLRSSIVNNLNRSSQFLRWSPCLRRVAGWMK